MTPESEAIKIINKLYPNLEPVYLELKEHQIQIIENNLIIGVTPNTELNTVNFNIRYTNRSDG